MKQYDYIFTGAGLSGLMTAWRMSQNPFFRSKQMLLIDSNLEKDNDRTWCFWENGLGDFDPIVSHRWHNADFKSASVDRRMVLSPFIYKMIRGEDFYNFTKDALSKHPNVDFLQDEVIGFSDSGREVIVSTKTQTHSCHRLINSLPNLKKAYKQSDYPVLLQHFIGWKVKTKNPIFDPKAVTFMDFTVPQKGNTRFMYVLPFSEDEALVEYTLFSKDLLADDEYESSISDWLTKHNSGEFEILETERGAIPMTSYPFWKNNSPNILNIGSAGGWTKASTGFTFANTARLSKKAADFLATGTDARAFYQKNKFWFYDLLLLDVLAKNNGKGSEVFASIFAKSDPDLVFRFLDEKTTTPEDFKVIWSCPKLPFVKALFNRIVS